MSLPITRAMVLAAGFGKRLRPITDRIPKPLVEVNGTSLIDYALNLLDDYGVEKVVVNSAYKASMIHEHMQNRESPTIILSPEPEDAPLETGGGIAQALTYFDGEPFFSMNSDTILVNGKEPILDEMAQHWHDDLDVLMCLQPTERAVGYAGQGDFVMRADGALRRRAIDEHAPYVFTGTQIIHPRLFATCPEGAFSLNVLYDRLKQDDGHFARIGAVVHEGDWLHVGDAHGLELANSYYRQ